MAPAPSADPSTAEHVHLDIADGIAMITLNDPARRNSVTAAMSRGVAATCARIAADPDVRAVVLTAAGPAFSAGGDIDSLADGTEPLETFYLGFDALAALPVPTIAAVGGPAVGAGVNFVLACDVVLAGRSGARFDPRFLSIGIHPGGAHLWRLHRAVGPRAATALVILGEAVDAAKAEQIGLVWRCVDDESLLDEALRLARRAARRSPELVRRTKASLAASANITDPRIAAELERSAQEWSMRQPAFAEGVRALREQLGAPPR